MTERLTIPGFVNAHSHAFQRALRGRTEGGDFWAWRESMLDVASRLAPGQVRKDYVAVYRPGQRWEKAPPQPVFNGFPVVRAIQGTRSALENLAGH